MYSPIYFHNQNAGWPGTCENCNYVITGHMLFYNGSVCVNTQEQIINILPGQTLSMQFYHPTSVTYNSYQFHFHITSGSINCFWSNPYGNQYEFPRVIPQIDPFNGTQIAAYGNCMGISGQATLYDQIDEFHFTLNSSAVPGSGDGDSN